jgi:hypothetical protein
MANFEITGKVEETDESSYTNKTSGEIVTKIQLSLVIPTMRDRVRCELPLELAPKADLLSRWELEESWVVVSAESMRALAFERSNVRPGEKPVGALVVFQATKVREASVEERKQLQEARKAQKLQAKQRRAARQAERQATKAASPATTQQSA